MKIFDIKRDEISTRTLPYRTAGTYFLLDANSEVIYVGKAQNVIARIMQHRTDKDFERIIVIETNDSNDAHKIESVYLNINKPLLNKIVPQYNDLPNWVVRNTLNEISEEVKELIQELIQLKYSVKKDFELIRRTL